MAAPSRDDRSIAQLVTGLSLAALALASVPATAIAQAAPIASAAPAMPVPAPTPAPVRGAAEANLAADPAAIPLERLFSGAPLEGAVPRGVQLSPDGTLLTMLRPRPDNAAASDIWARDIAADGRVGEWRRLVDSATLPRTAGLTEAERMQRERQRLGSLSGIISYQWAPDGQGLLIPYEGDLFLAARDGAVRRLTDTAEGELNPALAPDGGQLAFTRDGRLYVQPTRGEAVARAITPAEPEGVLWGEAEFVAQEELSRFTGFWWAPDSRRLAVARVDERGVALVTRTSIGAGATRTIQQRYPLAGTDNALVDLYVMGADGTDRVKVDLGPDRDIYVARVDWMPSADRLLVQRLDRAQSRLDLLSVDPATGGATTLLTDRAPANGWINVEDNYRVLKDGSLIWWSERSGFGHLYHVARGRARALTSGPWAVRTLVSVDEAKGQLIFTGDRDGPLRTQVYALDYRRTGASPRRISDAAFSNGASAAGGRLIVTRSNDRQPPQTYLADTAGRQLAWVEENRLDAAHPYAPYLASHRPRVFGTLPGADGMPLAYEMVTPALVPGKTYPVWYQHYGGPSGGWVRDAWGAALIQHIVDRGYIFFQVENRGSNVHRGQAFNSPLFRAMGGAEVADQRAGLEWLKRQPGVDASRIITYGWSYGGYLTLKKLQADPGLYAAGIAGAPVTRWELYDTAYTERYMGDPRREGAAYARANALEDATKISDPLLVIHGLSDDNVVFDHSAELIARMQAANVPFELMVYPGQAHGFTPAVRPHLWSTIFRFVEDKGLGPR